MVFSFIMIDYDSKKCISLQNGFICFKKKSNGSLFSLCTVWRKFGITYFYQENVDEKFEILTMYLR